MKVIEVKEVPPTKRKVIGLVVELTPEELVTLAVALGNTSDHVLKEAHKRYTASFADVQHIEPAPVYSVYSKLQEISHNYLKP